MTSGQEQWATQAQPPFTSRNSPQFQPAFEDPTMGASFATYEQQMNFSTPFNDGSAWLGLPQQINPSELTRVHSADDITQSDWNTNFLLPTDTQIWPSTEATDMSMQPAANQSSLQRSGLDPQEREQLREVEIPSLQDQDRFRKLDLELAKVRQWLEDSRLGRDSLSPPRLGPPRARSHTSPNPRHVGGNVPHGMPQPAGSSYPHQSQGLMIPGPGAVLHVADEDEDDDSFEMSDDQPSFDETTTPPALADPLVADNQSLHMGDSAAAVRQSERYAAANEPWTDHPEDIDSARIKEQPPSSNAAIGLFMRRARDFETASVTATLGSRRRSEADMKSLTSRDGADPEGSSGALQSSSRLRRLLNRRNSSNNAKKRKDGQSEESAQVSELSAPSRKDVQTGGLSPLRRVISRPRSPRLDVNVEQQHHHQSGLSPTLGIARRTLSRMRSRSDLTAVGNNSNSALAEQWARQGGPPVPSMRAPEPEGEQYYTSGRAAPVTSPDEGEGDEEGMQEASTSMSMQISEVPAGVERTHFRDHILKLNYRISPYMLDRLTNDQLKRFRRLVDSRAKHNDAVQRGSCPVSDFCNVLGRGPKYPTPSMGRGGDSNAPVFWVSTASSTEERPEGGEKAHFPEGIPLPPVNRLPAEFECPICFQVKKILKPSDWTKHVNEDIQPFTCTFPDCTEARSFKRKADWVRHESERHRHLEAWQCDIDGCSHRCYRRDNFVQHLVREHRLPEPARSGRAGYGSGSEPGDAVARQVERCRQESQQRPQDEPCRFCGNVCTTWKKLSVHLAQHMQQISIPTLQLVGIDIRIGSAAPPPLPPAPGKGARRQPHTPLNTSPGSRTPSGSVPGSVSNPQSSVSSGEGWDQVRTPVVSVTDTSGGLTAPTDRRRAQTMTPLMGSWPNLSGKDRSRFPVVAPPSPAQPASGSGLGVSFAGGQAQQQRYQQYYASPLTPHTPQTGGQGIGFGGAPQQQPSNFGAVWPTYPPQNVTTTGPQQQPQQAPQHPPQLQMQGIVQSTFSDSPVDAQLPEFSASSGYHMMAPTSGYQQAMQGPTESSNQYYGMQSGLQYSMAQDQSQGFAQSRSPFGEEEEEIQQHHSATYPPQFYHPGSG